MIQHAYLPPTSLNVNFTQSLFNRMELDPKVQILKGGETRETAQILTVLTCVQNLLRAGACLQGRVWVENHNKKKHTEYNWVFSLAIDPLKKLGLRFGDEHALFKTMIEIKL